MNRYALDTFCRQYGLTGAAIAEVLTLTNSRPTEAQFRCWVALLCQCGGWLTLALGVIACLAVAWQGAGTLGRFGLLLLGVVACVGLARWRPAPHLLGVCSLFCAMLLLGALLWFLDGSYPTGLTPHGGLGVWVLLTLPLTLVGRCALLWAVWSGALNVALALWLSEYGPANWGALGHHKGALLMLPCLFNLGMAAVFSGLANTTFRPTQALGLVRWWTGLGFLYGTAACMVGIMASPELTLSDTAVTVLVAFAVLWLTMGWATWPPQVDDGFTVALLASSFTVVSTVGVAKALPFEDPYAWGFLGLWVLSCIVVAGMGWHYHGQIRTTQSVEPTQDSELA